MFVSAARSGDRAAFGRLYDRYARMVHGVLLAKVPVCEVDDLVQDVFLLALRRLSTLRETGSFGAWLAAIARNLANDYHRRSAPEDQLADDTSENDIEHGNIPVLVRMETLRRATIYARQDPLVAKELLTRLQARAANSDAAGHPEALAWFDVGYLAATYMQWIGKGEPNPATGLDGYGLIRKAISLRGQDPEMEFAAALITLTGPESDHQHHARKAMAGAKYDPLLAQNLASNFNRQTISELLATPPEGGFSK